MTFGDGSAQSYAYEADDDLSSMGHTFPTSSHNVTLTWSNDKLGRQVSETTSNSAYLYDPPVDNTAYTAAGSLNQTAPTTAAYTWASHGALSSDGVRGFFYDEKRNLTLSRQGLASANNFDQDFFDALGVRWWSYRSAPSASDPHRIELTDGLRPEVAWEELSNTAEGSTTPVVAGSRYYVLGPNPDERLIWIDASVATLKARYPHSNRRGDTIAMARDGLAETKFKYGPFGESADSTAGYPWRFTGQRLNSWTGLYHFKARAYSPTVGRFIQPDPIGYGGGINLYVYVGNDPVNFFDPEGQEPVNYRRRIKSGNDLEKAERNRLRSKGYIIISGRVSASYPNDGYLRGREYDVVAMNPKNGDYYLGETKFRKTEGSGDFDIARKGIWDDAPGPVWEGVQIAVTIRQAVFDFNIPGEITLRGRGIPGGEITLQKGEYNVYWVVADQEGRGVAASTRNAEEIQKVFDAVTGGSGKSK